MPPDTPAPRGRVLVVCTGNICRSPYLERVMRHRLAGAGVEVSSAGTGAVVGAPMDPESEARVRLAGADPTGFTARQLTASLVEGADLVLTAARSHRADVMRLVPRAMRYTFALGDFSDLVAGVPADPARTVAGLVAEAGARRLDVRARRDVDIVDPYRRGPATFDEMVDQVEAVLPAVVAALS